MQPVDLSDLPEEVRAKALKSQRLHEVNSQLVTEIQTLGGGVDLVAAMIEHFMASMVEFGVLTQEQFWDSRLSWEMQLKPQLIEVRDRVRQMHAQRQITRPTQGLIVPGRH